MADTPNLDADLVIEKYVKVRDKKDEIKKQHVKELEPYNKALEILETKLLMALNAINVDSLKSEHGTAFKVVRSSVKIEDWDTALGYLLNNNMEHMLERRLNKTAVSEFVESAGSNFPGTSINNTTVVQVRRGSK